MLPRRPDWPPKRLGGSLFPPMLEFLKQNPPKARTLGTRILDGMREIGVLLMAFAPLDVALNRTALRDGIGVLVAFVGVGALLFVGSLVLEWRRSDDD